MGAIIWGQVCLVFRTVRDETAKFSFHVVPLIDLTVPLTMKQTDWLDTKAYFLLILCSANRRIINVLQRVYTNVQNIYVSDVVLTVSIFCLITEVCTSSCPPSFFLPQIIFIGYLSTLHVQM